MDSEILYLCEGHACDGRRYVSCREDGMCKHTTLPSHAINGPCVDPKKEYDRFDEITKFSDEPPFRAILVIYVERVN